MKMAENDEFEGIAKEIVSQRNLPYTLKIERIDGEKIYCRSSWGNHILYVKKKDKYFLESEIK
jgi:hypothetical protein